MKTNAGAQSSPEIPSANPFDLAGLTLLDAYINHVALLMSAALTAAEMQGFALAPRQTIWPAGNPRRSYSELAGDVLTRVSEIRHSLVHLWAPSPEADALAMEAAEFLAKLTPVPDKIMALCRSERDAGFAELARHLEMVEREYRVGTGLIGRLKAGERSQPSDVVTAGFTAAR